MLNRLSIKSKLVIVLILVSLFSSLLIGYISWRNSRAALTQSVEENMLALRHSKASQVHDYFTHMRHTVEVLSENEMVVQAMVRFGRAFRQLENRSIPAEWDAELEAYYDSIFFDKLLENLPVQKDYNLYRPGNQAGVYLQYNYIVKNPFEEKSLYHQIVDEDKDDSDYQEIHNEYNPLFRNLIRKWGFDDLILVNFETGDVVYTVAKQTDLGFHMFF